MKTQSARSLYRRLLILLTLVLALGTMSSSTEATSEYTGCGTPYIKTYKTCWFWRIYCYESQEGCADCDQGTACYSI